jgi:hypothetical protein
VGFGPTFPETTSKRTSRLGAGSSAWGPMVDYVETSVRCPQIELRHACRFAFESFIASAGASDDPLRHRKLL